MNRDAISDPKAALVMRYDPQNLLKQRLANKLNLDAAQVELLSSLMNIEETSPVDVFQGILTWILSHNVRHVPFFSFAWTLLESFALFCSYPSQMTSFMYF